ncbi:hypothetical protein PTKIN_Ptkin10aG0029200 [Pterospermum kingtungense]
MADPNKDIPQDITNQILRCLPVKSLTRFKCVSQSWRSVITSPSFTRNQKLLIPLCGGFKSLDLEKPFDEKATKWIFPRFWQNKYYRILGSCHGLVCLLEVDLRYVFFLWNPCTGESNQLPDCDIFPLEWRLFNFYGFGYDSISDDYKILLSSETKTVVFSLAENLWRTVHEGSMPFNFTNPDCYNDRGLYSNGALHWNVDLDSLCTFDLRMERFQSGPSLDASMVGHKWKLFGMSGETLYCCGIKEGIDSIDVELWSREKYCLEGSWTKVLCIPCSSDLRNSLNKFLCISRGNGFISLTSEDITRFDVEGGIFQKIKLCSSHSWWCECHGDFRDAHASEPMTYVETLVSPGRHR